MRKLDLTNKLSDEDITWLRAAGHWSEEQIATHQAQFDAEVPDPETPDDPATRSALDASSSAATPADTGDGPRRVDPTEADPQGAGAEDDYETWTKADLENEVSARNADPDTTDVEVVGTGSNGNVTKADLIKGLRLWDQDNPEVPED